MTIQEGEPIPEGPELSTSRDFLRKRLVGRRIVEVQVNGGRYATVPIQGLNAFREAIASRESHAGVVSDVDVKGKFMHWTLGSGWHLWCTYGMSGTWQLKQETHCDVAVFHRTTRGGVLEDCTPAVYFSDPRHYGTLKLVHDPTGDLTRKKLESLGPDMLNDPPSAETFYQALDRKRQKTLVEVLMDQSIVSGVGNYVKAEALYAARLSPHRTVSSLDHEEVTRLRDAVVSVMRSAYESGGATIATYRRADGTPGQAQRRFAVYGQGVDPMGNTVVRELTRDSRTTHWVREVQR